MGARDKGAKERCLEAYKKEKRNIKRCICYKKEVHEQFGNKMSEDVNASRKLFCKEGK